MSRTQKVVLALAVVSWVGWAIAGGAYLYRSARAEALEVCRERVRVGRELYSRGLTKCMHSMMRSGTLSDKDLLGVAQCVDRIKEGDNHPTVLDRIGEELP